MKVPISAYIAIHVGILALAIGGAFLTLPRLSHARQVAVYRLCVLEEARAERTAAALYPQNERIRDDVSDRLYLEAEQEIAERYGINVEALGMIKREGWEQGWGTYGVCKPKPVSDAPSAKKTKSKKGKVTSHRSY